MKRLESIPLNSLKKGCHFSDIHFGRKSNSPIHNQDCIDFLDYMCEYITNDPTIDYVAFLGDWHESRTAIDISTLQFSYEGAKRLNALGIPVFFLVGNHDMGLRFTREVYSTVSFNEFKNFILIHDKPFICEHVYEKALFVPFLSKDEYPSLNEYTNIPFWAGHFEFQGFVLTGYSVTLDHGPEIEAFKDVNTILSGHFHKRQSRANTIYIGNTFPMDFGDANDNKRGFAIFDHVEKDIRFIDWKDCPNYLRAKLSDILDEEVDIPSKCYLDVEIDTEITYQQLVALEEAFLAKYTPRNLRIDESSKFIVDNVTENTVTEFESITTDDLIIQLLKTVESKTLNTNTLIDIFRNA